MHLWSHKVTDEMASTLIVNPCDQEHVKGDGLTCSPGDALQREDPFSASFLLSLISRKKAQI